MGFHGRWALECIKISCCILSFGHILEKTQLCSSCTHKSLAPWQNVWVPSILVGLHWIFRRNSSLQCWCTVNKLYQMPGVWNYASPQFVLCNSLFDYREAHIAEIQLIRQPKKKFKIIQHPPANVEKLWNCSSISNIYTEYNYSKQLIFSTS